MKFYVLVLLIIVFLFILLWLLASFIKWEFLIPNTTTISWFDFRIGFLVYTFFFSCAYKIVTERQDENI